ncbi:unnamed protein product [Adineta ricciae]|uniref:Uncharacterized protein n=1 Tax=Adineta ricciae TaxID=249248 RepID=A0A815BDP6_ADIRI|nr:unnamed protein product [Adineta ricciae]CAF1268989.1 unnamed protein product [Adineta ricciae]
MDGPFLFFTFGLVILAHVTLHTEGVENNLWGVTMLDSEEGVIVNVGSVDPLTGQFHNRTTTFCYLGGAAAL